jgi:4-hydroxythreonine-4-phosphate dehydrogenase
MSKPIIGISQGDPNGVGFEVVLKTLQHDYIFEHCIPVLYANPKTFTFYKKQLNLEKPSYTLIRSINEAKPNQVNLIVSSEVAFEVQMGKASESAGKEALLALERMLEDVKSNKLDAIVTAPLDKSTVKTAEGFSGHTGFITKALGAQDALMILYNDDIRVGLVTEHIPISQIANSISRKIILEKLKIANESLKKDFGILKPKIALLGLNPHSGDNGTMGKEEIEMIKPAIEEANKQGIFCMGPYSADGFFGMKSYHQFDMVLAMYHDQGLIPFKSMAFDDGVNYTAGLTIIRTSPDHGTAYDIAGKDIALPLSFCNALFEAIKIYHQRNETAELRTKPLGFSELKRERFRLEKG